MCTISVGYLGMYCVELSDIFLPYSVEFSKDAIFLIFGIYLKLLKLHTCT